MIGNDYCRCPGCGMCNDARQAQNKRNKRKKMTNEFNERKEVKNLIVQKPKKGLNKVALTKVLRDTFGFDLHAAKLATDAILNDVCLALTGDNQQRERLIETGAIVTDTN